jgi:hypothetical protein
MEPNALSEAGRTRAKLAKLLQSLRAICRSGLPAGPLLERLRCALAEGGDLGRLITIVPRRAFTPAVPRVSFAIDKQMVPVSEDCTPQPVLLGRRRRGWYKTRDHLRSDLHGS